MYRTMSDEPATAMDVIAAYCMWDFYTKMCRFDEASEYGQMFRELGAEWELCNFEHIEKDEDCD